VVVLISTACRPSVFLCIGSRLDMVRSGMARPLLAVMLSYGRV